MARKINLPPGAVVFTGNQKVDAVNIHHLSYDKKTISDKLLSNHTEINFINNPTKVDWYDIRGLHDEELIKVLGGNF